MNLADLDRVIKETLDESELDYEREREGSYLVRLPGEHKRATMCWLVAGDHSLLVEAFVVRKPDENAEQVYRWLLEHNAKAYGVAFSIDHLGDIYLVGRLPHGAVTPDELDRVLGSVLTVADGSFNRLLELGFASSIRREWEWRVKRGESLANLQPFAHFADPTRR